MSRRSKWILAPLAAVLAVLGLFVLIFDWGWLKGLVEDQASSALGRPVEIGAFDVALDWDLSPRILLDDVRVANPEWAPDEPMAVIPHAEVEVDLWALVGGSVVLPDVVVEGPEVALLSGPDGQANWRLGGEDEGGEPSVPVIGNLDISNASVRYTDLQASREVKLSLADVQGQAPAEGDIRLHAEGEAEGRPLTFDLTGGSRAALEGSGEPFPFAIDLEVGDQTLTVAGSATEPLQAGGLSATVQVESRTPDDLLALIGIPERGYPALQIGAMLHREGETLRFEQLDLRFGESDLQGSGEIGLGEGPLRIAGDLRSELVRIGDIDALWRDPEAPDAAGDQAVAAGIERARATLEQARPVTDPETPEDDTPRLGFSFAALPEWTVDVRYGAGRIQGEAFEVTDLNVQARLEDQVPALEGTGRGSFRGEPVTLDARLGTTEGGERATASPDPIDVRAEAGESRLVAEGTIAEVAELRGIDLRIDARSPAPTVLLAAVGVDAPDIPGFEIAGHLIQNQATWQVQDLLARVGDSQIQGTAAVDRSGEVPLITADLSSSRLIASDFMPGEEEQLEGDEQRAADEDGALPSDNARPLISAAGINLEALPEADVDLSFSGDYVEVREFVLEPVTLDLRIADKIPVVSGSAEGRYRDSPLHVEVQLGSEAFLEDGGSTPYPVDLVLISGDTRAEAHGTVQHPGSYAGLDAAVALEGPDLDQLGDILQISMPQTPPYTLAGQLTRGEQSWTLRELDGTIGDSDIHGEFTVEPTAERPTIRADLRSDNLDFDDLGALVGAPVEAGPGETASPEQEREAAAAAADTGIFPDKPLEVPDLRMMDARVHFVGDNVKAPNLPMEQVLIELRLEDGTLRLEPLEFRIAGGELTSTIVLDARPKPIEASFDIGLRNADLQQILQPFDLDFAELETQQEGVGTLFGRAQIETAGNSIHAMAAAADGKLALIMDGGRINALIVEAIGLDLGEVFGLLFEDTGGADMVPVRCFVADFEVQSGTMQTRALVLDTADSKVTGAGQILLGEERLDLRLKAHPRDASVLTASTPVHIHGPLSDPQIEVISDELIGKGLAALGLGVVLPVVGAVIPFIESGDGVPSNCNKLLEEASSPG